MQLKSSLLYYFESRIYVCKGSLLNRPKASRRCKSYLMQQPFSR